MNIERLKKILKYSYSARGIIEENVRQFYSYAGISGDKTVLNIMQIVRTSLTQKGYQVLEIPLKDEEIGAFCYKGDALGYIILNSSLPVINENFALCHEVYHVFFQENQMGSKLEFVNDHYFENEEEFAANLFAGMLLMPEESFRLLYKKFKDDSSGDEFDTLIRLMNYYRAPYMAVLIRSYELELAKSFNISAQLLTADRERIRQRLVDLWLDETILDCSTRDDYAHMEMVVKQKGQEYVDASYINSRTLNKVLKNMRGLYDQLRRGKGDGIYSRTF